MNGKSARLPDPADLLSAARFLSEAAPFPITDARLRRAVSTAYYALFHKIAQTAADRFVGPDRTTSPAYVLVYRSFDHGHMRATCESLNAGRLSDRLRLQLRRTAMSQNVRDFASAFPSLQEARHAADYNPDMRFDATDVFDLINAAEVAVTEFDQIERQEQSDVLALMMVKSRT